MQPLAIQGAGCWWGVLKYEGSGRQYRAKLGYLQNVFVRSVGCCEFRLGSFKTSGFALSAVVLFGAPRRHQETNWLEWMLFMSLCFRTSILFYHDTLPEWHLECPKIERMAYRRELK